jgi:DNA invertase Pin-like site-specific DNA recombinase
MKFGYARVSTTEQDLELQHQALQPHCDRIFSDHASGKDFERPAFQRLRDQLREGDAVIVWKLDRVGRSLPDLLQFVQELEERGVHFHSLTEGFDTSTAGGRLFFAIAGAFAEYERNLIRERTKAGLEAARARGRVGGRKPVLDAKTWKLMHTLYEQGTPVADICAQFRVGKSTFYRYLQQPPRSSAGDS